MAAKRVRLKDVAERAGVAVNTASTILNRRPNSWASKATEKRVFDAAKELGYQPNRAAQALRFSKFHAIGLSIADLHNPYYTTFASVLEAEIERQGYDLIIESWRTDVGREEKILKDLVFRNVDGVAAFLSDVDQHREFLDEQAKSGKPLIALGVRGRKKLAVDAVLPQFDAGLREAVDALLHLGHRRFAFLAARSHGRRVGKRPALFRTILKEKGFSGDDVLMVKSGHSVMEAREAVRAVLSKPAGKRPTAIMALNDITAVGVMRAAKEAGLRVPEDVSVIGVDDIPLAKELPVSLSTVAQPIEEMARRTAELLMKRIDAVEEQWKPEEHLFSTHFIARESVGPAPSE